ncbi:MAG: response regulator [Myxococcaceae bacterium]|nr:response regulator [Myxococcaceae bacterium]
MSERHRILLIDDDAFTLKVVSDLLLEAGFTVDTTPEVITAISLAARMQPSLIILDQVMPIMSGRDLLLSLKALPVTRSIPVVFLTGESAVKEHVRALLAGAADVWTKPMTEAHVQRARELCAQSRKPLDDTDILKSHLERYALRTQLSGSLQVNPGTALEGTARFEHGQCTQAHFGTHQGLTALQQMLQVSDGVWRFDTSLADPASAETVPETALPGYRPRVLVVDDDQGIRKLLQLQLTRAGFDVETAEDGHGGLRALREAVFDVIVADLNMPGLDGWGMLRLLKDDVATRETPVLLLSAHDEYRETLRAAKAGAADYVSKTGKADDTVRSVRALAAPRIGFQQSVLAHRQIERVELSAVGAAWALNTLSRLGATGYLDASDDFGAYSVSLTQGRLKAASARVGPKSLSGNAAIEALWLSRCARASFQPGQPTAEPPTSLPLLSDVVRDVTAHLMRVEQSVISRRLEATRQYVVDTELYALYLRVGADRDVRLAKALCEEHLAPQEAGQRLGLSAEELNAALRELVRRGVLSFPSEE